MDRKTSNLISMLVVATFIVMTGLWIIDINMSLANLSAEGVGAKIGSFLFSDIDPRLHYHMGLVLVVLGFLVSIASWQVYSVKKGQK